MGIERGKRNSKVTILQIADLNLESDFFELNSDQNVVLRSNYVVGSGRRNCNLLVEINENSNIEELILFNKENTGYVVIFPGSLVSFKNRLPFCSISNSAVLIERMFHNHTTRPEEHFGGLIENTRKIFFVLRRRDGDLQKLGEPIIDNRYPSLTIYRKKTFITASSNLQKAVMQVD